MPVIIRKDDRDIDCTIGILTWNSKALLEGCLGSIFTHPIEHDVEVVVIDNDSADDTLNMVRTRHPEVHIVENEKNVGVSPARNQVIEAARGRYVLFLDVDTLVTAGSIDTLITSMDADPAVGIAGPRLIYEDKSLQLSCRPFPSFLNIAIEGTNLRDRFSNSRYVRDYTMEDWDHADAREVDWMYGACLIIRAAVLKEIGPFDERFFYLYEDVDICFRAKKHGHKVMYLPEATIVHFLRRERKKIFHGMIRHHLKSLGLYFLKDYYGWIK